MGDRTSVTLEVPQAYKDQAIDIFGSEPQEVYQDEDIFEARWEEVNYGGESEHNQLVKHDIPHILTWADGGSYGPGSVIYDGQNSYEVSFLFDEECPVVRVDLDGTVNPTELANVLNYYQAVKQLGNLAEPSDQANLTLLAEDGVENIQDIGEQEVKEDPCNSDGSQAPDLEELMAWEADGGCEATDGCWVEPDGVCEHGCPSWLLVLGLI